MNFQSSLEYLLNLGNEVTAMKLGLENITKLLAALGNPQNNFTKIQVAGTNGKGSTCAFLDAICVAADIKTGLYTSPHLISITERVKIGGVEISETDFARHATRIREVSEKLVENSKFQIPNSKFQNPNSESGIWNPASGIYLETVPTFFEQVTAIALNAFAEAEIELAILETGLGGRYDATTAAKAEIAAITPIDYDHQEFLGDTLTQIAAEKAAIIRAEARVIYAPQKREAEQVILGRCREVSVEPILANGEITVKKYELNAIEPLISANFKTANDYYQDVILGLRGRHQLINASLAISIAEILNNLNFKISKEHIRVGLETAKHNGRLELHKGILFDGAHNVAGAAALREYLDEFIKQPITMIFGAMRDKNLSEIAEILFPKAENLIFTRPENSRSMATSELMKFAPNNNEIKIFETQTVAESIEKAREISSENDLILVTGSLYLVGEAQKEIMNSSAIQS